MTFPFMKITTSPSVFWQDQGRCVFSLCLMLVLVFLSLTAQAERAQQQRMSTNLNGDLVLIGNMLVHCSGTGTMCTDAQNGVGDLDNYNDFTTAGAFALVDVDGVTATTNSSSANLNMPAGSTVVWAGLYWGSRYSTSGSSTPPAIPANTLKFRTPALTGYQTIAPSVVDTSASVTTVSGVAFQAFADVTALVQAGGNGTYWGADISTVVARNAWAGWSLVVVYTNPNLPFRNFAVYDGLGYISGTVTMTPSGFLTPASGPVVSRLGVVLWDGDDGGVTAERLLLNGTSIINAANPTGEVWNSTISDGGGNVSSRNPNYINTLGVDIDRFNVPAGVIPNSATSATISVVSPGTTEIFWFGIATFMTDIYVPTVIPNVVKTAQDMSPGTPLLRGDTLRWNVVMSNTGYDSATNLIATDIIPAWLTYVPGSMRISSGANSSPPTKTDAAADDQADFLIGPNRVVFRLGSGASATQGGTLAYGQSTSFYFDTTVNSDTPAGTLISNEVQLQYNSQTLPATTFAASSAAASATLMGPPTIVKSISPSVVEAGQSAVMTITLSNPSSNPEVLTGVTFSDTYPTGSLTGMVNTSSPNPQVNCTPGSSAGTLTGGVANGNSIGMNPGATIAPNGSCIITVNVMSETVGTYLNTTSAVSSTNGGAGNTASATLFVGKPKITKAFSPATINAGATSTITFTLQNLASTALSQVQFSDPLTNMQVAASPNVVSSCGGTVTAAAASNSIALGGGSLPANGTCTISVDVTSNIGGTHPNTTTGVSSLESGSAGQPSNTAQLTVVGPPTISKSFSPVSVRTSSPSTLTVIVSNPNTGTTLSGVAFTDTYPGGVPSGSLVNSTPSNVQSSCTAGSSAGTITAANGGGSLAMSGGSLLPGGSCSITVNVQSSSQATFNNVTGTVSGSAGAGTLTGGTASASLIVANRLTVAKAFATTPATSPVSIPYNNPVTPAYTASQMTITVTASSGTPSAINGINFEDVFPSGMIVANSPSASVTGASCTGAVLEGRTGTSAWGTVASGNTAIRLTSASVTGGGSNSCVVSVNVTSNSTAAYTNSIGTVYSTNGGTTAAPVMATLNVLGPPVLTKSFSPTAISTCSSSCNSGSLYSVLTYTLTNPTTATVSLTGVGFVDAFETNLMVSTTPTATSSGCGGVNLLDAGGGTLGSGDTGVSLSGVTLAPNATCTVSVRVRSATAGVYDDETGNVTSTNGGTGAPATATLWVASPSVAKAFSCTRPIIAGAVCQYMTLGITAPTGVALASPEITDIFPLETATGGGFKLFDTTWSTTGTCPASPNAFTVEGRTGSSGAWGAIAAGNTAIRAKSTGNITAGSTCTLQFRVTSSTNATNIIPAGGLTGTIGGNDASNASAAQAILQVYDTPTVQKSFAASSILVNGTTEMKIEISHLNNAAANGVAFDDLFPASVPAGGQMYLASPLIYSNGCNGTLQSRNPVDGAWRTMTAGDTGLKLSGSATIPAISSCIITANVTAIQAGDYTNTISSVSTSNFGSSNPASANIKVMAPPTLAKAFTPNAVIVNETSLLTLTLTNPNVVPVTGTSVVDNYPSGLVNAAVPNISSSCPGAVLTAVANGSSMTMSSATIPANGSCSVSVQVTSATAGVYNNTTNVLTSTNAGNGAAAGATLTVSPYMPTLNLLKSVSLLSDPVNNQVNPKAIPGSVSRYTVRITNSGPGTVDNNTVFIRDVLPPEVELFVGVGVNPTDLLQNFAFTNGTPSSGLSCTFGARNNGSDCVDFSSDGISFTYTPSPGPDGFDTAIKAIQFRPSGSLNAAGGGSPWAEFSFQVRVK